MYLEITRIPPLNLRQRTLLEAHTLLNIYGQISAELVQLGRLLAGDEQLLHASIAFCAGLIVGLSRPEGLFTTAVSVNEQERRIFRDIRAQLRRVEKPAAGVADSMSNLRSLFTNLRAQSREVVARSASSDEWAGVPVALLEAEIRDMFAAVEQNSHGRFRIIFNSAMRRALDYHLTFEVDSGSEPVVVMPRVFKDVIRDLVANARKYTPPGGRIRALLRAGVQGLRFTVEDNGRGIPAAEIRSVVHFGVRGSNVKDVRSTGGGFGLTKAFVVTKRFGGRFWIESQLGKGTRIRIWLPPPPPGVPLRRQPERLTSALASTE